METSLPLFWNSPTSEALYEVMCALTIASACFGRLRQRLWNNPHVSMRVKGKIYHEVVLSILLCGAEAWTVYRRQVKRVACLHDAISAFDHEDNLDRQNVKQGNTQTDRAAIY